MRRLAVVLLAACLSACVVLITTGPTDEELVVSKGPLRQWLEQFKKGKQ